jgi:hypothetical protein
VAQKSELGQGVTVQIDIQEVRVTIVLKLHAQVERNCIGHVKDVVNQMKALKILQKNSNPRLTATGGIL